MIKEINDIWIVEVKKHLSNLNNDFTTNEQIHLLIDGGGNFDIYNENRIITQNNWVNLLKELSSKTAQSLKKKFPNINDDLSSFLQEDLYQE